MLVSAFLFPIFCPGEMEMFLGINTWDDPWDEMSTGALIAALAYLLVGAALTLWPTFSDTHV